MMLQTSSCYMPAIRPLERAITREVHDRQIEKGQRMFVFYSTPHKRPWPDMLKAVDDSRTARYLKASDKARRRSATLKIIRQYKDSNVRDRPRIPPFKGECIKKMVHWFKNWRAKRLHRKFEDWVNKEGTGDLIFAHTLLDIIEEHAGDKPTRMQQYQMAHTHS